MIVLDTNVVSEPLKTDGNVVVQTWLDQQSAETLYLTATSLSELLVGIEILPKGRRKAGLAVALTELMTKLFKNRILPFDERAAIAYAPLVTRGAYAIAARSSNGKMRFLNSFVISSVNATARPE